jgi:hypothetical protein
MKITVRFSCFIIVPFLFSGCAEQTHIASVKAVNHGSYSRIFIRAAFDNVGSQMAYEEMIHDALLRYGEVSIESVVATPPLRIYSDSEIIAIVNSLDVDAILTFTPSGVTTGSTTAYSALTNSYNTHQTVDAIYYEVTLYDVKTSHEVYRASISTQIDELTSSKSARHEAMNKLCGDLYDNGFILLTNKPRRPSANPNDN